MAVPAGSQHLADLEPNVVYLTFNQPEKDDYHRGLFLTASKTEGKADPPRQSGTLFHAVFAKGRWGLERRSVTNIANSKSLVLMWKIGAVQRALSPDEVEEVLSRVPCRADTKAEVASPTAAASSFNHRNGHVLPSNAEKGGFSCVAWTDNALLALNDEGVIRVAKDIRAIVTEARAQAGPEDARKMVGKDFGGLRVVNGTA